MSTMDQNTAVLLFARTPGQEACAKPLAGIASVSVWRKFHKRTVAIVKRSGLPLILINEHHQCGASFGKRLAQAFYDVFALGFERVLVIGNDSPDLQTHHLKKAARLLHTNDWVLGPDVRGGTFLIGARNHAFRQLTAFDQLPWQETNLFASLKESILEQRAEFAVLAQLKDLNSINDLFRWLGAHQQLNWVKSILGRLFSRVSFSFFRRKPSRTFLFLHQLRGPPAS